MPGSRPAAASQSLASAVVSACGATAAVFMRSEHPAHAQRDAARRAHQDVADRAFEAELGSADGATLFRSIYAAA